MSQSAEDLCASDQEIIAHVEQYGWYDGRFTEIYFAPRNEFSPVVLAIPRRFDASRPVCTITAGANAVAEALAHRVKSAAAVDWAILSPGMVVSRCLSSGDLEFGLVKSRTAHDATVAVITPTGPDGPINIWLSTDEFKIERLHTSLGGVVKVSFRDSYIGFGRLRDPANPEYLLGRWGWDEKYPDRRPKPEDFMALLQQECEILAYDYPRVSKPKLPGPLLAPEVRWVGALATNMVLEPQEEVVYVRTSLDQTSAAKYFHGLLECVL